MPEAPSPARESRLLPLLSFLGLLDVPDYRIYARSMHYDCLVIGLGGMGSSTLYHLARHGLRVHGFDRFSPVHSHGSSHGEYRIFRKAYFEHPDYVPLLQEAERCWRELEAESGASLYDRRGVVLSGPAEGEAIAGTLRAAVEHSLPVQQLSGQDARQRWPMLQFPDEHAVVFDEDAGLLAVEECVRQYLAMAKGHGATAQWDDPVIDWTTRDDHIEVQTSRERWTADRLVLTAGAWTSELLHRDLPTTAILRKRQVWHSVHPNWTRTLADMPGFFFETSAGAFYGMPVKETAVKVARHSGGTQVSDPAQSADGAAAEAEPCQEFAAQFLQGIAAEPTRSSSCLYTMSPDGHFIVDRSPGNDRVVFAAGFSGHGFKFASVIGKVLADWVTDGKTELPVDFLSLHRFAT